MASHHRITAKKADTAILQNDGVERSGRHGDAAAQMERDPDVADAIAALQPNYALAGESI